MAGCGNKTPPPHVSEQKLLPLARFWSADVMTDSKALTVNEDIGFLALPCSYRAASGPK